MRFLFIFLAAALSFQAEAKLSLLCVLERTEVQKGDAWREEKYLGQTYETRERDLKFVVDSRGQGSARIEFAFDLAPNYKFAVRLTEFYKSGEIQWLSSPEIVHKQSGRTVVEEWDKSFSPDNGRFSFALHCTAIDHTESLQTSNSAPVDERERARLKAVGGPGAFREYANMEGNESADNYDLFRQLRELPTTQGRMLDRLLKELADKGYTAGPIVGDDVRDANGLYSLEKSGTTCTVESASFTCDIEKFDIQQPLAGDRRHDFEAIRAGFIILDVYGRIFRETGTRRIRGYVIDTIQITSPTGTTFGGSSVTGGRIRGGQ